MAWTYSGNPLASTKDAVRFELQDTDEAAQLLRDEEIAYAVTKEAPGTPPSEGEVLSATARCMEALARKMLAQADTVEGSLRVTYSKQAKQYNESASELRERAEGKHSPYSGGLTLSEKRTRTAETDAVQPLFKRGEFNNPWAPRGGGGESPGGRENTR